MTTKPRANGVTSEVAAAIRSARVGKVLSFSFGSLLLMCLTASVHADVDWHLTTDIPTGQQLPTNYTSVVGVPSGTSNQSTKFVAVGWAYTESTNQVFQFISSMDGGQSWQLLSTLATSPPHGQGEQIQLVHGDGVYILINQSDSCQPWTAEGHPPQTCMWQSMDAINWTPVTPSTSLQQFYRIAYGNGRFVILGKSGSGYCYSDGQQDDRLRCNTLTSTNGLDWSDGLPTPSAINPLANDDRKRLVFIHDRFLFDGTDGGQISSSSYRMWASTDGLTWFSGPAISAGQWPPCHYGNGVDYGSGRYVALRSTNSSNMSICTSTDGINWSIQPITGVLVSSETPVRELTHFGGVFTIVNTHTALSESVSGTTWHQVFTPDVRINSIAAIDNDAVQVGQISGGHGFLYAHSDVIFKSSFEPE